MIKKYYQENKIKTLFYLITSVLVIFLMFSIFLSKGVVLHSIFQSYSMKDTFGDFFECILDVIGLNPYVNGGIYPPVCYIIYILLIRMIPSNLYPMASLDYLRQMQGSLVVFTFYMLITVLLAILLIYNLKKGKKIEKTIFTALICFSVPFLFQIERANVIIIALIFLLIYFIYNNSKNKILKEIALISLAISASIKIYPAIFGILFIKEKNWKDLIKVIIYGIVINLIAFLILGGFDQIKLFMDNLLTTNTASGESILQKVNFLIIFNELFKLNSISNILIYIILIISVICSFMCKSKWKTVLLLTCIMIGFPTISFTYTFIFLIIPLILFLDTKEKRKKTDYIYLILLILALFALPTTLLNHYGNVDYFANSWSMSSVIMAVSLLLMTLLIDIETIINKIKKGR